MCVLENSKNNILKKRFSSEDLRNCEFLRWSFVRQCRRSLLIYGHSLPLHAHKHFQLKHNLTEAVQLSSTFLTKQPVHLGALTHAFLAAFLLKAVADCDNFKRTHPYHHHGSSSRSSKKRNSTTSTPF